MDGGSTVAGTEEDEELSEDDQEVLGGGLYS